MLGSGHPLLPVPDYHLVNPCDVRVAEIAALKGRPKVCLPAAQFTGFLRVEVERPALRVRSLLFVVGRGLNLLCRSDDVPRHITFVKEAGHLKLVENRVDPSGCLRRGCFCAHDWYPTGLVPKEDGPNRSRVRTLTVLEHFCFAILPFYRVSFFSFAHAAAARCNLGMFPAAACSPTAKPDQSTWAAKGNNSASMMPGASG